MEYIIKTGLSALVAYSAHYGATKFYNSVCVPDGIIGYLQGLITTGSPVCQAGLQIISNTQTSYSSMVLISLTRLFIDFITPGVSKTV
jgi:hypothetical protein